MADNRHTGNIDKIKAAIALHGQPLTAQQLVSKTRLTLDQVRGALTHCVSKQGTLTHCGKIGVFRLYGLPGMMVKHKPKADMPRRYDPPFKVLERNPFEHRDLALVGPR